MHDALKYAQHDRADLFCVILVLATVNAHWLKKPPALKICNSCLVVSDHFADDLTNPPEFLNLPTASNYTAVMIPAGPDSYGHMNIAHPAVWAPALGSFLQRLPLER